MNKKNDLKGLVPLIIQEINKGRTEREVLNEINISHSSRSQLKYHVDRALNPHPVDEIEWYTFIPIKPKPVRYVVHKGIRYRDITAEIIDCGG